MVILTQSLVLLLRVPGGEVVLEQRLAGIQVCLEFGREVLETSRHGIFVSVARGASFPALRLQLLGLLRSALPASVEVPLAREVSDRMFWVENPVNSLNGRLCFVLTATTRPPLLPFVIECGVPLPARRVHHSRQSTSLYHDSLWL